MRRHTTHKRQLDALEALLKPAGRLIVVSTSDEAELIEAGPADTVIVTGVPRAPGPEVSA